MTPKNILRYVEKQDKIVLERLQPFLEGVAWRQSRNTGGAQLQVSSLSSAASISTNIPGRNPIRNC